MKTHVFGINAGLHDVPAALCLCFSLLAGTAVAGQLATVTAEPAPVYTYQQRSERDIVKSLKLGDMVSIEFSIVGPGGEWCAVREPHGNSRLGYMLCSQLRRDPVRQEKMVAVPPPPPANAPSAPMVSGQSGQRVAVQPDLVTEIVDDYMRPPRIWSATFHFTPQQQAEVDALADRTGVTECRRQFEAHARKYESELALGRGPYLPREITPALEQRTRAMVQELNLFLYPCMVKMADLLEGFPALMTAEQQANTQAFDAVRKQIADMRRALTSPDVSPTIR